MALRWRKNPAETGLRRIGSGPRGHGLYLDKDTRLAWVDAHRTGYKINGWYWVTPTNDALGIEHRNTCDAVCATDQEAKDAAMAYVKSAIAAKKQPAEPSGSERGTAQ